MTVSTSAIVSSKAGVNVADTHDVAQFKLGSMAEFTNGNVFRYCRTQAVKAQGSVYVIGSDYELGNSAEASVDNSTLPHKLGVPQIAVAAPASGYTYRYCWVQTAGLFTYLKMCGGTTNNNPLYLSSLSGALCSIRGTTGSVIVEAVKSTQGTTVTTTGSTTATAFSTSELVMPREFSNQG